MEGERWKIVRVYVNEDMLEKSEKICEQKKVNKEGIKLVIGKILMQTQETKEGQIKEKAKNIKMGEKNVNKELQIMIEVKRDV